MHKLDIRVGYAAFLKDGGDSVGSVHQVSPDGRLEIVIYVENAGDFVVPFSAIKDAHSGKVILDVAKLPAKLRSAIRHAHDSEPLE
jgi:hypothetical protein